MGIANTATTIATTGVKPTVFVNISNHSTEKWSMKQLYAAKELLDPSSAQEIIDIPFPDVDPNATENDVESDVPCILELTGNLLHEIFRIAQERDIDWNEAPANIIVHAMGEMTLVYKLVASLTDLGFTVVASTTKRHVVETQNPDGTTTKTVLFGFCRFRQYCLFSTPKHVYKLLIFLSFKPKKR